MKKITFLLGSGISIPAGLPDVRQITRAVIAGEHYSGEKLVIDQNGCVLIEQDFASRFCEPYQSYEVQDGQKRLRRILILLAWLNTQAYLRYAELQEREVNYEDLAYLACQISDDIFGEYENPALVPFIQKALIELHGLRLNGSHVWNRQQLGELARTTVNYIRQVVALLLGQKPSDTSYFGVFARACTAPTVSEVNLFTLNHDTLLEDFLTNRGITAVNGLRPGSNWDGSLRWDPSVFDNPLRERRVNMFYLHGPLNWRRWEPVASLLKNEPAPKNPKSIERFVGMYVAKDPETSLYRPVCEEEGPQILAGTFNKIFRYNSCVFLDLHHRFHKVLQTCGTLVVCGYGFGDKGINTRIVEWRRHSSRNKILIIDPAKREEIITRARGAIQEEISISSGDVMHWQKSMADASITWEKIEEELQDD